jgi:dCTP deaminase
MTLLSDDINAALDEPDLKHRLIVTPLLDRAAQVGPGSIDLRLGTEFLEIDRADQPVVDVYKLPSSREAARGRRTVLPLAGTLTLHPGQFILGSTFEFLSLPLDISGQVVSRSSWGRLGLLVATAVAVQPGFKGVLTLELVNTGSVPIVLRPGARIAQLQVWRAANPASQPYSRSGKYRVPLGPEPAKLIGEQAEMKRLAAVRERLGEDQSKLGPTEKFDTDHALRRSDLRAPLGSSGVNAGDDDVDVTD